MALAAVAEYDAGSIKHTTRPKKEQDRVDHIETLGAQTGLVFLAWRDAAAQSCRSLLRRLSERLQPAWHVETSDGGACAHSGRCTLRRRNQDLAQLDALYVADGHHCSAAASRVCAAGEPRE